MVSDVVGVATQPEQRTPVQAHEGDTLLRTHLQSYRMIYTVTRRRFNHINHVVILALNLFSDIMYPFCSAPLKFAHVL